MNYLVVTKKSWNIDQFNRVLSKLPGHWHLISEESDFTFTRVEKIKPTFIFFPHWSTRVPREIYANYYCVGFHETDLPFGRGGSPIQNLISRGIYDTQVTAIKMVEELDAGPILLKRPLKLNGSAQEIFKHLSTMTSEMITEIVSEPITLSEQQGDVVEFSRREPAQSELNGLSNLDQVYDHIRMLDAEGYPPAFLEFAGFRFEFDAAKLCENHISAGVKITKL